MKTVNLYKPVTLLVLITMSLFSLFAKAEELEAGVAAPGFVLSDQYRKVHSLIDYQGQWLVLYFYPKDDTPGCTREACNFRDDIVQIRELNAEVFGISVDNAESHAKFAEKHGLPFALLSDADGDVAKEYGALMSLGPLKIAKRHSFIIDPEGKVAKVYRKVNPDKHSEEIIADLTTLINAREE